MKTSHLTFAAVVAALYAALTIAVAPASFGLVQMRASEALVVLPFLWPAAAPGLFVGCVIANAAGMAMGLTTVWDVVFGSLATLIAALITSRIKIKWLAPLPAVVINAVVIGPMLAILFTDSSSWLAQIPLYTVTVGAGEAVAAYALGLPLLLLLERAKPRMDRLIK